ncbi:disulfide bond formation protein B [Phreatobacter sp.]|uniref:disulfide bond formation protein B n=1 Tax=Phreatobacter sp. TaxID=1966341 RepID=UPI0022C75387|nr:disulfide bond formation protein B [Phreatobacter sp.]MCZ8317134.1 disulfide bond formation protein B [Phreatobacter sp.]
MTLSSTTPRGSALGAVVLARPWLSAALFIAAAGTGAILGAYFFEFVVGLSPCPLCLQQRVPYYAVIPAALVVAGLAWKRAPAPVIRLGLLVLAGLMIWGAGLGIYHAGAEWGFWPGPTTCAQPAVIARNPADLLRQIQTAKPLADCTVAAWRFLGVSLAGWNALIATVLAALALVAASRPRETA